jgi:hypothetical protein
VPWDTRYQHTAGVGESVVTTMGQSYVANPKFVILAKDGNRVPELMGTEMTLGEWKEQRGGAHPSTPRMLAILWSLIADLMPLVLTAYAKSCARHQSA